MGRGNFIKWTVFIDAPGATLARALSFAAGLRAPPSQRRTHWRGPALCCVSGCRSAVLRTRHQRRRHVPAARRRRPPLSASLAVRAARRARLAQRRASPYPRRFRHATARRRRATAAMSVATGHGSTVRGCARCVAGPTSAAHGVSTQRLSSRSSATRCCCEARRASRSARSGLARAAGGNAAPLAQSLRTHKMFGPHTLARSCAMRAFDMRCDRAARPPVLGAGCAAVACCGLLCAGAAVRTSRRRRQLLLRRVARRACTVRPCGMRGGPVQLRV